MTTQPQNSKPTEFYFASFWLRIASFVVDTFVLGILTLILRMFLSNVLSLNIRLEDFMSDDQEFIITPFFKATFIVSFLVQLVAFWLYYALTETRLGATPGKYIFNYRVTRPDGRLLDFKTATGHAFARILGFLPFLTGYLMAAFTDKKQALHDIMADCIVIPAFQVVTTPKETEITVEEKVS